MRAWPLLSLENKGSSGRVDRGYESVLGFMLAFITLLAYSIHL